MGIVTAVHQPNYLPYLGYFYKIAKSDVFVFLDEVQYPRGQSFAARNRIRNSKGSFFLTIPISIPLGRKGKVKYTEISFSGNKWRNKHLKTIQMSYGRSPYFKEIFEIYSTVIERNNEFVNLNIDLVESFSNYLCIGTKFVRMSELNCETAQKTELIINILKEVGSTTYLSGNGGGKEYNDEKLLNTKGIDLVYSDFQHPKYKQTGRDFIENLSFIDLLFNCGPESKKKLLKQNL